MTKKRNHHIPRLLLRRFAFRANKKTAYLWQFRKDASPVEVETRNAGVESFFYGVPETGIEDKLADLETNWSSLLADLDAGADLASRSESLRRFVWILAFRTRALRAHFAAAATHLVNEMASVEPATMASVFLREFDKNIAERIEGALALFPKAEPDAIREALRHDPTGKQQLLEQVRGQLPAIVPHAAALLRLVAERALPDGAARGQLSGLTKILGTDQNPPGAFDPAFWSTLHLEPHAIVLGDGVVVAVGPGKELGAIGRFGKDWQEVYVPIAHDRVLVGRHDEGRPTLDAAAINDASVGLSHESFFAARNSEVERGLARRIGTLEPMLTADEGRRLASDSWRQLGERSS